MLPWPALTGTARSGTGLHAGCARGEPYDTRALHARHTRHARPPTFARERATPQPPLVLRNYTNAVHTRCATPAPTSANRIPSVARLSTRRWWTVLPETTATGNTHRQHASRPPKKGRLAYSDKHRRPPRIWDIAMLTTSCFASGPRSRAIMPYRLFAVACGELPRDMLWRCWMSTCAAEEMGEGGCGPWQRAASERHLRGRESDASEKEKDREWEWGMLKARALTASSLLGLRTRQPFDSRQEVDRKTNL
ncbi:hypothetical protein C8R47DRAFT_526313 [Mycena vitilis]|nr:hypothetical protein C8R47DRAFT_526313 [Mycena vitilis]